MKTKDLVYIGVIAYLAYLLLKKRPSAKVDDTTTSTNGTPIGNASNGGLNLGSNMDLPNLTPTPENGLSTEVALNSSNVSPIIRNDNEPTQIFGNVNLPTPYVSGSIVTQNPIDVVPVSQTSTTNPELASTETYPAVVINPSPTTSTNVSPYISGIDTDISSSETTTNNPSVLPIYTYSGTSSPIGSPINEVGSSIVTEPSFPIKTVKALLIADQPDLSESFSFSKGATDNMMEDCGNSFSIPNNDKEGSYTNFWFDGTEYYTQTTSPLIKTIPTKISKTIYFEGCKKLQLFKSQNITN